MSKLYSFKNMEPNVLPNRIRLSTGLTKTDPSTFTEQDLLDAGYVLVAQEYPSFDPKTQKVVWDINIAAWTVLPLSDQEQLLYTATTATNVRQARNTELQKLDVEVIKQLETSGSVSDKLKTYRQALRDITLQPGFPHEVNWPVLEK